MAQDPVWWCSVAMGCGASGGLEFSQMSKVVPVEDDIREVVLPELQGTRAPEAFEVKVEDQLQLSEAHMVSFKSHEWPDAMDRPPWPGRPEHERHLRRVQRFMRAAQRNEARFRALIGREA